MINALIRCSCHAMHDASYAIMREIMLPLMRRLAPRYCYMICFAATADGARLSVTPPHFYAFASAIDGRMLSPLR